MEIIKQKFKNLDKVLLFLTISLFIFGLLNIVTASSREAVVRYEASLYHYFYKQFIMIIIGLIGSIFIIMFPTKNYKKIIRLPFILIVFICFYMLFFGSETNGATNWFKLPIINMAIQPSEFAKIIIIVYLSLLLEKYDNLFIKNEKVYDKIGIILVVGLIIPIIVFLQKDFGTMLIMIMIFFVLFISSSIKTKDKIKTIVFLIICSILVLTFIYLKKGYIFTDAQMSRFDFYNPCSKYENTGYQVCNGYIAINNGGLLGLGLGKSKQIYSYIPEPHTDSVFAIIAEENGVLKCSIIFMFYIIILYRILKISSNASSLRGRYICLGVAIYIFMHIFLNLGGLFGIIPLTGVPLPFLSYGGSYAISLMCSLALVQRVNIEKKNSLKKIK